MTLLWGTRVCSKTVNQIKVGQVPLRVIDGWSQSADTIKV